MRALAGYINPASARGAHHMILSRAYAALEC